MIKSETLAPASLRREDSVAKAIFWSVFDMFGSMARLLIEAFIRRDLGERYFPRAAVIRTALLIALWPLIDTYFVSKIMPFLGSFREPGASASTLDALGFLLKYFLWYLYLAGFLYAAFLRLAEIKRLPSALDLKRYSYSTGRIREAFFEFEFWGKKRDERFIECWLEPAPFFLAGLVLAVIDQPLGWLLIFSSIAYSVSYQIAYFKGDNIVMDIADHIIIQKSFQEVFMNDADMQEAMGLGWRGRRPVDMSTRQEILQKMIGDEGDFFVE